MPVPETATATVRFEEAGRTPSAGDNAAIATRLLPAGTVIELDGAALVLSATVLEGHRFAIGPVGEGELLLSWGLPFGRALRPIRAGEYICNEKMLAALRQRKLPFELPAAPNFSDYRQPFSLDEAALRPGAQFLHPGRSRTFSGFAREGGRGIGTRNYIVVLGTSSHTGAWARQLAARFKNAPGQFPNIDGVVAVEHTEGGESLPAANYDVTLRTLAGFVTHPNVAAVLAADFGTEFVSNRNLRRFMEERRYPLASVTHRFLSTRDGFEKALVEGERIINSWLPLANAFQRAEHPVSGLRIGLQCGGSDAFSGVSGNPLVGIMARETVAYGGSANLAETDELIGAESYVLENVRDLSTAKAFLEKVRRFQEWAGWHGHSAEGNPSGGNMYRGLYNISIKAIGAARKKDPRTRLDAVIDFAEPMTGQGFYFMDSPGNDLESIAGQVAAGCNMILFATGNGSVTNFPFVPTIKVMTTTARYDLLRQEMDFNAGRYQDGEDLEALGEEAFDYMLQVASGQPSAGEKAGHSQVQLWREWRGGPEQPPEPAPLAPGEPHLRAADVPERPLSRKIEKALFGDDAACERIALILPTSLCSGQVARQIAAKLNAELPAELTRAVALPHTEGCGNSQGDSEQLFLRTMTGYLVHPCTAQALLLEHGCEKTHNDAFRNAIQALGIPAEALGWASIQLDGGIERASARVIDWFRERPSAPARPVPLTIGFYGEEIPQTVSDALEEVWLPVIGRGGSVITADASWIEGKDPVTGKVPVSLAYGQRPNAPGYHLMECPTSDPLEIVTGLGACGATVLLTYCDEALIVGNPVAPSIQLASMGRIPEELSLDADLLLDPNAPAAKIGESILRLIGEVRSGKKTSRARQLGNIGFQVTRGMTGISL